MEIVNYVSKELESFPHQQENIFSSIDEKVLIFDYSTY